VIGIVVALAVLTLWPARGATINATVSGFDSNALRVVDHVVDFWERTILNSLTVNVSLSMLNLAGDSLGESFGFTGDVNGLPASGTIRIDNRQGSVIGWFVDPTPALDEEYVPGSRPWHRRAKRPGPAGNGFDLMTVLNHEFTHLFGFSTMYSRFAAKVVPSDIETLRDYQGDTVTALLTPVSSGTHLSDVVHPFDLMNEFQSFGERIVPSDLDLAILSDAFGYSIAGQIPVPEPSTFSVMAVCGLLLLCQRLFDRGRKFSRIRRHL
jgi:hypothetical protein